MGKNTVITEVIDDAMAQIYKASQMPIFTHHATEDGMAKLRNSLKTEYEKNEQKGK